MKTHLRNTLVSILSTVLDAVRLASRSAQEEGAMLLAECIEGLQSIDDVLEEHLSEGKARGYHKKIEKIAELIHDLYKAIMSGASKQTCVRRIDRALASLESCLMNEEEVAVEVLFLPYKAAMWDSMESVWRAASQDARCNAVVVPIPYFDKNPDGSICGLHYEGTLFPDDVPTIHFEDYDIGAMQPDIAYIHNPYDEYNVVTSVHPRYYSGVLKTQVKTLVYIPYYSEYRPHDEQFIHMPGALNADYVIAQSEQSRQEYLKFLPPEKVLALGSPKFDKVLYMEEHNPPMPTTWAEIVRGRKLVLYNTTLSSMLAYGALFFEKLRTIFRIFTEREDVILLWRPHPLGSASLSAMRPGMKDEYDELVEEYKRSGIGIFDDSPDLNRAIALSSAYYGDFGSLLSLYGVTGKPMLLQDYSYETPREEDDICALLYTNIAYDKESAWCSATYMNGLFHKDLATGRTTWVASFPDERPDATFMHIDAIAYKNHLFFAPAISDRIVAYTMDSQSFANYPIPHAERYVEDALFSKCVAYKQWLFLIPAAYPAVLRFDMETRELTKILSLEPQSVPLLSRGVYVDDDTVYAPFSDRNEILEINMESCKSKTYKINQGNGGYSGISHDGERFWITPHKEGPVILWEKDQGVLQMHTNYPEGVHPNPHNGILFDATYFYDGCIWCVPTNGGGAMLKIDVSTGDMEPVLRERGRPPLGNTPLVEIIEPYGLVVGDTERKMYALKKAYSFAEPIDMKFVVDDADVKEKVFEQLFSGMGDIDHLHAQVESRQRDLIPYLAYCCRKPKKGESEKRESKFAINIGESGRKIHDAMMNNARNTERKHI